MAKDGQKLLAERLYIQSATKPSLSAMGREIGVDRDTIRIWRDNGGWDLRREEWWHRFNGRTEQEAREEAFLEAVKSPILDAAAVLAGLSTLADVSQPAQIRLGALDKLAKHWGLYTELSAHPTKTAQGVEVAQAGAAALGWTDPLGQLLAAGRPPSPPPPPFVGPHLAHLGTPPAPADALDPPSSLDDL